MKLKTIALGGALILLATPMWAATYFGGFEDTSGTGSDYDYNDIVFSIRGATLVSSGSFFGRPTLNDSGNVFWDHTSQDHDTADPTGADENIGFCVYGPTSAADCENHPLLDAAARYLAAAGGVNSVTDVTFTVNGGTSGTVLFNITSDTDALFWYNTATPTVLNPISTSGTTITGVTSFGLVGQVNGVTNFYSNLANGPNGNETTLGLSHFAFFAAAVPEPATMALVGFGLLAIGLSRNRKKA